MNGKYIFSLIFLNIFTFINANDVLGCGGFLKSHVQIDFSKVVVKLFTKQGILKDQTNCAPNSGYYFIPLYDKGDYILQLEPPPGWSFEPTKIDLHIDRKTDICSEGQDINFVFKGFGITGKVESAGSENGPSGIEVKLKSDNEIRSVLTSDNGAFFFTPVYPGTYTVIISHPKWKFAKNSISVIVTEGNTDLPAKSLVIAGYDVRGMVKSDGEPIKGTSLILYGDKKSLQYIAGCDKAILPNIDTSNYLCHITSNEEGVYEFLSVPTGNYHITPFYKGQNIHFQPNSIKFTVEHGSCNIEEIFEIIGFSVRGRVLSYENGTPFKEATVYLNNERKFVTKEDGYYTLEKIKAGTYTLAIKADNHLFDKNVLKINPSLLELPSIFPSSYRVCGKVISENSQMVIISRVGSTQHSSVNTHASTGQFCEYLKPGKYDFQVVVNEQDKLNGIQFFPISITVEVTTKPILDIVFSQLKATVSGLVQTLQEEDRNGIKVILRPIVHDAPVAEKDTTTNLIDDQYTFEDVRPGLYEVLLTTNSLCWKEDKHLITVTSSILTVPPFQQSGYLIAFTSTHDAKVIYKLANQSQKIIDLQSGRSTQCVERSGKYIFKLESCHTYPIDFINYDTNSESNEVYVTAIKHRNTVLISAAQNFGDISIFVNIGGVKTVEGPVSYQNGKYKLDLYLIPKQTAILTPQSETLYFNPPILQIAGGDDCINMGVKFIAVEGKVFQGKIIPPLAGVQITIVSDNSDSLTEETDANGNYRFPPLDDTKSYQISALMDSYVLVGPNENGDFLAHKLAEIIVEVVDQVSNEPLQGALLSLSGAQSYRSNLQTNTDGKITFHSLSPSEYFLKPMMKEYNFEPSSKIITVEEGATVNVLLKGKRVAYSAFGQVTSLNGEPEERIIVVAAGRGNCSQYSEESSSESNGQFRIRGLLPYCTYNLEVKGNLDEKDHFERAAPSFIELENISKDIENLKFIIFRPPQNTDVLLKVQTPNPEHYRSLKVKVTRESAPSGLVHMTKIDTSNYKITKDYNSGILMQLPAISMDNKYYSVQLESSLSQYNKLKPPVEYFHANSSFKYIELKFQIKTNTTDQHIKQTSIWTLVFIFCGMIAIYNIEQILDIFKENFSKINVDALNYSKSKSEKDFTSDNNDIDQIVQSINATKRKVKPKKI